MKIVCLLALVTVGITNQILCGPGDLAPGALVARSGSVRQVDCSSPAAIVRALKIAVGAAESSSSLVIEPELPALPSMQSTQLSATSAESIASASVQPTCPCDTPFAFVLPFYPTVMTNWGANAEGAMHIVAKMNPNASGSVFRLYKAVSFFGIQNFLKIYPQAQPVGLQLYAQAQQNPQVQKMDAQIKELVREGASMQLRVGALLAQTSVNTAVRQQIIQQTVPTFSPGQSIPETIRLNDGKNFDADGQALLAGNIYASIGDMSDQHKVDPHAYAICQMIFQVIFPL